MQMEKLFEIKNLRCSYDRNYREGVSKVVLEIRDLILPKGRKIFIVGESGIGKSTILEVLGLMNNTIVSNEETKFLFYENDENPIIVYTDYTMDNNDKFNLYVSQIVASEDGFTLETINDYSDIPEIQKTLEKLWQQ